MRRPQQQCGWCSQWQRDVPRHRQGGAETAPRHVPSHLCDGKSDRVSDLVEQKAGASEGNTNHGERESARLGDGHGSRSKQAIWR